jgi:dTDP-4-dehydrorhamnose 3,5-epimerase
MKDHLNLEPTIKEQIVFQSYLKSSGIDGVTYTPLKKHRQLEGWFMELYRLTEGHLESQDLTLRQVSLARAEPGRINAFHIHPKLPQDEVWCVVDGSLSVWLVDLRTDSPTLHTKSQYLLSGEAPALLQIPAGVAHGYKAGPQGALLIYGMNQQFNPDDPNEGRLPWDYFGAELWEADRG